MEVEEKMLNEEFKTKVVTAFIREKENVLSDFRADQKRKLDQASREDTDNKHIDSKNDETLSEVDFLNDNMDNLEREIVRLKEIPIPSTSKEVGFGSLVLTDHSLVLVGAAQNNLKVDGVEVAGVSTESPFYNALESKGPGDHAEINGRLHKIRAVV